MYSHDTSPVCRGRLLYVIIACSIALTGGLAWFAAPARADGDPASDVLATGPLFLPQDAGIPEAQLGQLGELVQAAQRRGYPVRVALIASPTDLGSITELWRQPASYAKFLGQELSLTYQGLVLVVMPNGFGLYHLGHSTERDLAAIAGLSIRPRGAGLAVTALTAVRRLAAAAGHPLALARAQAQSAAGSSDIVPWIVFAAGFVLIVAAWAASVRARPLGQPRRA